MPPRAVWENRIAGRGCRRPVEEAGGFCTLEGLILPAVMRLAQHQSRFASDSDQASYAAGGLLESY